MKTEKDIELNVCLVYDERYITKKILYGDIVYINFSWVKCARRWSKMQIFYNHFYLCFTSLWEQLLSASIFRQLHLWNCRQANLNDHLFDSDEN